MVGAAVLALVGGTIAASSAAAASNSSSASTQLSLQAAPDVLSVTVSPSSGTFGGCYGGDSTSPAELGFPNGICSAAGIVVTNTGLPGHMMVTGSPMSPVGGGSAWVLCGSSDGLAPTCNNGGTPGADQYQLKVSRPGGGERLSTQPQCDRAFGVAFSCSATPGRSSTESALLIGPQGTSNGASNYTTTITWTVTP